MLEVHPLSFRRFFPNDLFIFMFMQIDNFYIRLLDKSAMSQVLFGTKFVNLEYLAADKVML